MNAEASVPDQKRRRFEDYLPREGFAEIELTPDRFRVMLNDAMPGGEWPDNHRRFALLAWVAAALGQGADPNWRPDILHCHDWHAGLAPAVLNRLAAAAEDYDFFQAWGV